MGRRMMRQAAGIGLCTIAVALSCALALAAEPLLIDDYEAGAANRLGGRSNTYVSAPSRALAMKTDKEAHAGKSALMIKYDKKNQGGPYGQGGWCGYYTLLKVGSRYFDATEYRALTFWIKGSRGGENFVLGAADRHWEQVGDSVKSEPIGKYLAEGKITADWQKAVIPLDTFMIDMQELSSVSFCFEGSVFPAGAGKGTLFVDDLTLE